MENSFKSIIDGSKSILIMLPTKPFFDQVASGLGLYLSLRDKKDVQVYSTTPMTVEFNRLIGVNKISQELGNKNLIIRFVDYKASDIERVSYDIENGQFRLTVIPKQRINPPQKEQIELSYTGISADTVVMIGGANESHFPALATKELTSANIVHIGIRDISLASNKSYISFAKPASSVSEITASLIKESGLAMDEDVATNLLMGIEQTTNNYTDPSVNAETFMIVSELMRTGGRRVSSQVPLAPTNFPPGAIPSGFPRPFQPPTYQPQGFQARVQASSQQTTQQPVQQMAQQLTPQPAQLPPQPPSQPVANKTQDVAQEEEEEKEPPKDWLQPKIYKGTSLS